MKARVAVGREILPAEILDTPSGKAVAEVLPFETAFSAWGDEITFSIPMHPMPLEEGAGPRMEVGDIAYWPEGNALVIFFGPDPARTGTNPVASSPMNRIGRILGDATRLRDALGGATIRIEPA